MLRDVTFIGAFWTVSRHLNLHRLQRNLRRINPNNQLRKMTESDFEQECSDLLLDHKFIRDIR